MLHGILEGTTGHVHQFTENMVTSYGKFVSSFYNYQYDAV
jgi:hypothetical protein